MTPLTTTPAMEQAWQTAIAQADSLTLPDHLWERPQVQGFTIDGPTSRDLDDAIWIEKTETGAIVEYRYSTIVSVDLADAGELVKMVLLQ